MSNYFKKWGIPYQIKIKTEEQSYGQTLTKHYYELPSLTSLWTKVTLWKSRSVRYHINGEQFEAVLPINKWN
jgi:hypothetical protein